MASQIYLQTYSKTEKSPLLMLQKNEDIFTLNKHIQDSRLEQQGYIVIYYGENI